MSRNRERQRKNRKKALAEENLDRYNAYGVKDITPYEAIKKLQRNVK